MVDIVRVPRVEQTARGKMRMLIQHLDISGFLASGFGSETLDGGKRELRLLAGKSILMLSTSPVTRGGIAAVVKTYLAGGLFDQVAVQLVSTHVDGSTWTKMGEFGRAAGMTLWALLNRRPALVHAHVSYGTSFWRKSILLAMARSFGVPTLFHLHSGGFLQWAQSGGRMRRFWIRRTMESSDLVVVLTESWGERIVQLAPKAKVEVLGNPVLIPTTALLTSDRASSHGGGRVLFLGWIYSSRDVSTLLEAWVIFRERCPGWRLAVGGKGEVEQFLAAAERLGVRDDLDFLGWIEGTEKERELRRADVFVLPSYNEGMPVSVLEAMAYGVAVVATPVGGVPDMMKPDVHGLWVQPGDIEGLSQRHGSTGNITERRATLTTAAREHVVRHNSVQVVHGQLLMLYQRHAQQHRASASSD